MSERLIHNITTAISNNDLSLSIIMCVSGRPLPTFFLLFPTFSYFFKIFLFIPIFAPKFLFFPIFSLIWNKNIYFQVCSYMTLGATVEKISAPTGASILHWNSIHIKADLNIGLTHLKHRGNVCTYLYLDLDETQYMHMDL